MSNGSRRVAEDRVFELGLVMAGAVSAGAYTAGVIDFLIQALDEWEKAKDRGVDCPRHEVRIKAIAGASAGGMTAAMLAGLLQEDFAPITSLPGQMPDAERAAANTLYSCWVDQIDIERLLQTDDLRNEEAPVRSILDSTVLDEIADRALQFSPNGRRRYLAEEGHLFLTLTNLRGVPYAIDLRGNAENDHPLSLHADHVHFVLSDAEPSGEDALWLDPRAPQHENWGELKQAALATGAFPGGLAPRLLARNSGDYNQRRWPIPQQASAEDACTKMQPIPPQWPPGLGGENGAFNYRYLCVDGGVMNNEPFELARRILAGPETSNPRSAKEAARSVVMVDPFPVADPMTEEDVDGFGDYDVIQTLLRMLTSLKYQARFKLDELALAQAEDVYSRFLIAPVRYVQRNGEEVKAQFPIASGTLGGFGGFLSKRFRVHDFQLGRRNCQQFLRAHFVLPLEDARQNPIFAGDHPDELDRHKRIIDGEAYYPIIPLLGSAAEKEFPLRWNTLGMSRAERIRLKEGVTRRTRAVTSRLIDTHLNGSIERTLARLALRIKRGSIVDGIMEKIEGELERYDLLR